MRLLTLALGVALAFAGYFAERLNNERAATQARAAVQVELSRLRDRLDSTLAGNLQLVKGLISVINLEPHLTQARFERAVRPLFDEHHQLRNIAVAPGMVIRMVYPVAGNEKAIGLDYLATPSQRETAVRARDSGRIVLAGPLQLAQGGTGLIARMPVTLPDAHGVRRFWGLVSTVIDPDKLYRDAGLLEPGLTIRVAIRGRDATGTDGAVFFGDAGVFGRNPVLADINLPQGAWQMAAMPVDGWARTAPDAWAMRLALLAIAAVLLGAFVALGRALDQTTRAQAAAESARRQLDATLEGNPHVAVQWYDGDGRVRYWNRAAAAIYGWPDTEARGRTAGELMLAPEQAAAFAEQLRMIRRDGILIGPDEQAVRTRDGAPRWVATTSFAIPGTRAGEPLFVRMDVDITERKAAEDLLREAMTRTEAAARAKSQFLATMSHEIKTPLNGILGMAQLLLMPSLTHEEQQEFARTIHNSGKTLLTLLNDLLDLSKIEAGKLELNYVAFDPQQVVHEVLALFGELGEAKGLVIESEARVPADTHYWADAIRIRQILSNLMANAIKFTASGFVRIACVEVERDAASALLEFSVSDSGIGIPADRLAALFEPFVQADSSTTREYGGTGLGLSIVRNLAHLHGGSVGVTSEVGVGSRFWCRIRARLGQPGEDRRALPRHETTVVAGRRMEDAA